MNRYYKRLSFLLITISIVCFGLLTRKMAPYLPDLINLLLGDLLWATMVYFFIRMIFVDWSVKKTALAGIIFCFLIELSQLYQAEWINMIRRTTFGGLVLGFGFLWSDLLAYSLGIIFGIFIDKTFEGYSKEKVD